MDFLKKFFPSAFKPLKEVSQLVISILIYVLVMILGGVVIGLAATVVGWIPFVGWLLAWVVGVLGTLVDLYCIVAIVLRLLTYFNVLKD